MKRLLFSWFLGTVLWARHSGSFVENRGQVYAEARFEAAWRQNHIYLTPTGILLLLAEEEPFKRAHYHKWGDPLPVRAHLLKISWVGANPTEPIGIFPEETRYHFFLGPWRATDARGFKEIWYKNLYPGIDLSLRLTAEGLKWDWHVQNLAAIRFIRLRYEGASVYTQGTSLYVETSIGTLTEKLPLVYLKESLQPLKAQYRIEGSLVGYEILSEVVASPLVIDPVVVFSTFSGSYSDNWGFTATYDLQGNAFAGGNVSNAMWSWNPGGIYFPVTPGAVQTTYGGGVSLATSQPIFYSSDIAIWKANPTGTTRLWATYLGGSHNEQPHSMITDPQGNLYLMGATRSADFPVTSNAYQTSFGGNIDIIVAAINAAGNQLLGSTYLGGSGEDGINSQSLPLYYFYADDGRGEIFLSDTACYIISSSRSANFPTTSGAYRTTLSGPMDAVLCMLSLDMSQLHASTFLGGSGADAGYSIRIGFGGVIYAAGGTNSPNFPTTSGAYQTTYQGGRADGWLAVLSPRLDQLIVSTYWGTSAYDQIFMIDIDRQGLPWGAGHTEGNLSPTPGAYGTAGRKQFVFSMNETLSQVTRLSVWGSTGRTTPNITISAFAADRCGYIYVSGWGGLDVGNPSLNIGSTVGLPTTPNANQTTTDGADFYVIAFQPNLTGLAYASFWGGPFSDEHVDGGTSRFDSRGIIYQSVCGGCGGNSDFPTTPGSISTQNLSPNCNNALFKIDFELGEPVVAASAITPPTGCAPYSPVIQNLSQNGVSYYWDFGNGQTSTAANPTGITYAQPGTYVITLVAQNPATCNLRDTLRRIITVYPRPTATFTYATGCQLNVTLNATQNISGASYLWRLGDGQTRSGPSISYTYAQPDTYTVRLIVITSHGCSDSTEQTIIIRQSSVDANFRWEGDTCRGRFSFENLSMNAQRYLWIFSTGDTLTTPNPIYTFPASGTYQVTLIAYDSAGCSDTLRRTIPVSQTVRADFREEIDYCNLSVQYTDSSRGAAYIRWDFGDGSGSTARNPTHTYAAPGTYTVTLIAISSDSLCRDTLKKQISIDFQSQARAQILVDTCSQKVRFISRSLFANEVLWQIQTQNLTGDTAEWQAPEAGTYTWTLITNPSANPICRDTLVGEVTIPQRIGIDSLLWEGDICAEWVRFTVPLAPQKVLGIQANGIQYPSGTTEVVLPLESSEVYALQVIYLDSLGCQDTLAYRLSVDVIISRALLIPNVFTPNSDGINDIFRVVGSTECIQEMAIYDRWGNELYVTRTMPFIWDGRLSNGEPAPEGAYVYLIRLKKYVRGGTITLIR
ncbi:MAG: PKD domain-containing protein [Bacteroidia bacterium]